MRGMERQLVQFSVSVIAGLPRIVARFSRDASGLHTERFDRDAGRWVADSAVFGYAFGFDDWAEPATKERAAEVLAGWGFGPSLVDAPVTVEAATK